MERLKKKKEREKKIQRQWPIGSILINPAAKHKDGSFKASKDVSEAKNGLQSNDMFQNYT